MYKMDGYKNRIPMIQFPAKIDLGAGQYPKEGFTRIDFDTQGTDIIWDIKDGIPLPDGSVEELYSSHFLEHFLPTDFHYILMEIWRVCQNGAKVEIRLPHGDTPQGHLPCHYNRSNEATMEAIGNWFPDENNRFEVQSIERDGIHLIAKYIIRK